MRCVPCPGYQVKTTSEVFPMRRILVLLHSMCGSQLLAENLLLRTPAQAKVGSGKTIIRRSASRTTLSSARPTFEDCPHQNELTAFCCLSLLSKSIPMATSRFLRKPLHLPWLSFSTCYRGSQQTVATVCPSARLAKCIRRQAQ